MSLLDVSLLGQLGCFSVSGVDTNLQVTHVVVDAAPRWEGCAPASCTQELLPFPRVALRESWKNLSH